MCFDDDSHPPIAIRADTGASGKEITLEAADGTGVEAYLTEPGHDASSQILILPDVRGLHQFYKELAMRFAEAGVRALAIDYFGRTAPDDPRTDSFEYMPHVQAMTRETFGLDLNAGVAKLREAQPALPTYTIGFCYGGSLSFWSGTRKLGLAGVVGFYAGFREMGARISPLAYAKQIECSLLGIFGGADESIPQDLIQEFESKLNDAGIENEIVVYPDAPHSFFDRKAGEYAHDSADAWTRVQGFINRETVSI